MKSKKIPTTNWLLIFLLIFLSAGGFFGSIYFLRDPTGESLGLSLDILDKLPINDFVLPGIFLLTVMGIVPLIIAAGLWRRAAWARPSTIILSFILLGWILGQLFVWNSLVPIQFIYTVLGVIMLILCFYPGTKEKRFGFTK